MVALQAGAVSVSAVTCKSAKSAEFPAEYQIAGFAEDPGVKATGIMRPDMPLEQVLAMPPFVNALQKQRDAKDDDCHRMRAVELRQGRPNEVTFAERADMSQARRQREPVVRPGLPGGGEEVSQMLLVLPPSYTEVLIPFCEEETRSRPKTKGGSPPVVSTPVRKYSGEPKQTVCRRSGRDMVVRSAACASETPTVLAPQRVVRSPRLEETDSRRELIPICSVVHNEGRALVRSYAR